MKEIHLTQGKLALVDDEDYETLKKYRWCATKTRGKFYAVRNISAGFKKQKQILMHREILSPPADKVCDHINGDTLDNRRSNLRIANTSQNIANSQKTIRSKSGYRGVYWDKDRRKWKAAITVMGKEYKLGRYSDPKDAALAYDISARKFFGVFAKTNF